MPMVWPTVATKAWSSNSDQLRPPDHFTWATTKRRVGT